MSNPNKVDVVIAGRHISGVYFPDRDFISVPSGYIVAAGDIITVDGTLRKVVSAISDCVDNKEMSVNIYTAPVEQ